MPIPANFRVQLGTCRGTWAPDPTPGQATENINIVFGY